jgi:hypothetical protein
MTILLFLFYFIILALITSKIVQKKQVGIGAFTLTAAFACKVFLGCLYGYVFMHFYGGDDTWWFFRDSLAEYQKLMHDPPQFFKDFSPADDLSQAASFGAFAKHYLYDFEFLTIRKLLAFFNLFSGRNYYIDVLFFDFLTFWGSILLYRLLIVRFPAKKKLLVLVCFFIPSTGFWLSGIRAEGLIFLFMAMSLYYSVKWINSRKTFDAACVLAGLAGMLAFRGVFLLVFIPAWISLMAAYLSKGNPIRVFAGIYFAAAILFFASTLISVNHNFPQAMVMSQQKFFQLHGKTVLKLDSLQPDFFGFVRVAPQAFSNVFFHPFIWEARGILQIVDALDTMAFWILLVVFFLSPTKERYSLLQDPLLLFLLFYGFTLTLLIGFIVPFPGAIVRYKSIPEMLLILFFASGIHSRNIFKLSF